MSLPVPRPSNAAHTEQLIRAASDGEPFALGELYDRFATRLLSVALRLTGSLPDAEDVVHDVFVGLPEALRLVEVRVDRYVCEVLVRPLSRAMRGD